MILPPNVLEEGVHGNDHVRLQRSGDIEEQQRKKGTDPTESQIVRASVLESHGWNSEPNRSQCKLRVQEINSLLYFSTFYFSLRLSYPFFILCDTLLDAPNEMLSRDKRSTTKRSSQLITIYY